MNLFEPYWQEKKFVCVGLDPVFEKLPKLVQTSGNPGLSLFAFNKAIIDATYDLVCAYKPNSAFYEAYGLEGIGALKETVDYIKSLSPTLPVLLDAKRGDIGSTNEGYVQFAYDYLKVDAITVQPYMGKEALSPFLDRKDKLTIVLVKTSNPGSDELQNLVDTTGKTMYEILAEHIRDSWNASKNVGVVVGATYPAELAKVRKIVGDIPFLIPGIGAQGGDLEQTVKHGQNSKKQGMIINAARSIIYASNNDDFAKAARKATIDLDKAIKGALDG